MYKILNSLPFKFFLKVGDPGDGHEKEDKFLVVASHPLPEIHKAFQKAEIANDLFLSRECGDCEQNELSPEFVRKYIRLFNVTDADELEALSSSIDSEFYASLYLSIAILELKTLSWTIVNNLPERNIGGYGLFYN
jgi:hypothetical protein